MPNSSEIFVFFESIRVKSLCSPNFINDFEVLSVRVEFNELFSKGTEARGTL